jgi:hypothetical protein
VKYDIHKALGNYLLIGGFYIWQATQSQKKVFELPDLIYLHQIFFFWLTSGPSDIDV